MSTRRRSVLAMLAALALVGPGAAVASESINTGEYIICGPPRRCGPPCGIWGVLDLATNQMVPNEDEIRLVIGREAKRQTVGDNPEFDLRGINDGIHIVAGAYEHAQRQPVFRLNRFLRAATPEQSRLCRRLWHTQRGSPPRDRW